MSTASRPAVPWSTGTVEHAGETIYHEVAGDHGSPVVLCHGAGGSHAVWWRQVADLVERHRVVTWDCRGFGRSSYRTGVLDAAACAGDLLAVLDALEIDDAHLVGQSMGGWWATELAVRHPERVRSLALTCTIGGLYTDALDAHFAGFVAAATPDAPEMGAHRALSRAYVDRDPAGAFLYQELNTLHDPPMADVVTALVRDRRAHAELAATGVPVLVVGGADDPLFPAPLLAAGAALLPGARYEEVADAGHSPYWERPEVLTPLLAGFAAEVDARSAGR